MLKFLSVVQKNLVWAIPISMMFGLIYGYLFNAAVLKQFIIPVTFIMVYPMMVTLNVKTIFKGHEILYLFLCLYFSLEKYSYPVKHPSLLSGQLGFF